MIIYICKTEMVQTGVSSTSIGINKYKHRNTYVEQIEITHPEYLHNLYHMTAHVKKVVDLTLAMNNKSASTLETHLELDLNWLPINRCFIDNEGIEVSAK